MNNRGSGLLFHAVKIFIILFFGIIIGWFAHQTQPIRIIEKTRHLAAPYNINDPFEKALPAVATNEDHDLLHLLNALLKRHKFEAVITLYESLQQDSDFDKLDEATQAIFKMAKKLVALQDYKQAKKLLSVYLQAFNRDVDARLILIEVYYREEDYLQAIDALYLVKGHAYQPDVIQKIIKKTRLVVNKQADIFKKDNQYNDLLALYEKLTQLEADYAPYFIGLAEAQILLGNVNAAKNNLQMLVDDVDVGHKAEIMLAELYKQRVQPDADSDEEIEEEDESVPGIALIKRGNHYLIDAYPNGDDAIRLLIDTGASLTVLTPKALKKHNVRYKNTGEIRLFNTANGIVRAPIYQLDYLMIGDWRVDDINIAILELQSNGRSEGLLGMNFLQHFQFFIDQKNKLLHLSLR